MRQTKTKKALISTLYIIATLVGAGLGSAAFAAPPPPDGTKEWTGARCEETGCDPTDPVQTGICCE